MKFYITFGQIHRHVVYGKVFDKDCVAVIEHDDNEPERGDEIAWKYWDGVFHQHTHTLPRMEYFPRGLITLLVEEYYQHPFFKRPVRIQTLDNFEDDESPYKVICEEFEEEGDGISPLLARNNLIEGLVLRKEAGMHNQRFETLFK